MAHIYLSVPHMGGREEHYVHEAFASNWLSSVGPQLDAFEREFSARLGRSAVALGSGTAAMHLGLRLLGVGPGEEVFVDSDPATWQMSPRLLAEVLADRARRGRKPKAVVVVHLYGQCADMEPILEACAEHGVPVLEDAAESLGATYRGRPAGSFGDVSAFSFNGNKIITTTGGGMLAAAKPQWVEKARYWSTQAREPGLAYHHVDVGYNYRLSNVLAAIGRGQLEVLEERVRQRRAVEARYRAALSDVPGLAFMPEAKYGLHTHWLSCLTVDPGRFGASRDDVLGALAAEDIEARPLWKPMHLQPLYRESACYGGEVAAWLFERGLCLPSSSSLSLADQHRVVEVVRRLARRTFAAYPAEVASVLT